MFRWIYIQPFRIIIAMMIVAALAWSILCRIMRKELLWIISIALLIPIVALIVYYTIYSRNVGAHDLILIPFFSFCEAIERPEMYREMFMNIFMFYPIGLIFPFCLPECIRHRYILLIISSLVFSVIIEVTQLTLHLGRCEVDDVIMNTFGAGVGGIPFVLLRPIDNKRKKGR